MHNRMRCASRAMLASLFFFLALSLALPATAQQTEQAGQPGAYATDNSAADSGPATAPAMRAVKSDGDSLPILDGNVLGDPSWSAIEPVTGFTQITPNEGQPASEQTAVRIRYTGQTLYVGVVCYDGDPSQIIVSDSRRDADPQEADSFSLILDTYRDLQNGFIFGTNSAGVEYDAQVTNEGQNSGRFAGGPRNQSGSGGGLNINWDGAWTVHTETGEYGWGAEFAIPLRTLRFATGENQIWGVNFERRIRRRNETAYWAPLPRQYTLARVSLAGTLEGLDIEAPRNLQIIPYALGQGDRKTKSSLSQTTSENTDPEGDIGIDLKYSVTPSMTLDVTYNTDFAQVEVDEQQINLDRFNLFFPEKRPFFLENAGVFSVGAPGHIDLFFSRSIGIGTDGVAVPILGGARLSGSMGDYRIGLLNMQTRQLGKEEIPGDDLDKEGIPGNNFSVARLKREFPNRTFAGVLFTNRQGVGDLANADNYNRVFAVDGQLGIGQYGLISGFGARSVTPGRSGSSHAYRVLTSYNSEAWMLNAGYTEVAENFNPELGFLQRESYRYFNGLVFHRYRPDFFRFHELRPHISYNGYWGFDGLYETGFLHIDNHWEWENGWEIHTGLNLTTEGVRKPFEISEEVWVPKGSYEHREAMIVGITDESLPLSLNTRFIAGGFFGGDRVTILSTIRARVGDAFNTEVGLSQNWVDLPGGNFTANLVRARLSYSFTPRIYLQTLLQYNNAAELWSANLRFGWLQSAGTGLFIVFNHTSDYDLEKGFGAFEPQITNQAIIIKYSRLLNVLR